jgi:uncharacterized membrane protein
MTVIDGGPFRARTRRFARATIVFVFVRRQIVLVAALAASTALTVALGMTDPVGVAGYPTRFLAWNLFLAWIPLACALGAVRTAHTVGRALLAAGWLAFLPNAPYLMTDLVHLSGGEELWRHVLQYGFAAWTGTMLGVVSLRIVHLEVEKRWGQAMGWTTVAVSTGLCAIGVVIGRFQRWNSWDLVRSPSRVVDSTFDWLRAPIANVRSTGVAVAVAFFFAFAYVTIWALDSTRPGVASRR